MAASDKFSLAILFKVIDKASGPLRKVGNNFRKMRGPIAQVGRSLYALARSPSWTKLKQQAIMVGASFQRAFIAAGAAAAKLSAGIAAMKMGLMRLAMPLAAIGFFAVRTAVRFQAAMNMVGAVTNATGAQFNRLRQQALDLGRTTQFTAVDAASGMKFLAMSGLNVNEVIGAMPRVLELAASAQLDLGTAANISTNIMKGFGLQTKDLARVNDVLVNAFTNSNVDLQMLGNTFKYVGPVMKSMGKDIETTAAMAGVLGNAGIQSTMAGTAMRMGMLKLSKAMDKPTKAMKKYGVRVYATDKGNIDLIKTLKGFKAAGLGITELSNIVDTRAASAFEILMSNVEFLPGFIEKLREVGTAARIAEQNMRGLPGATKRFASAWEGLMISGFGDENTAAITKILDKITEFFRESAKQGSWLGQMGEAIKELVTTDSAIAGWAKTVGASMVLLTTTVGKAALAFLALFYAAEVASYSTGNVKMLLKETKLSVLRSRVKEARDTGADGVFVRDGLGMKKISFEEAEQRMVQMGRELSKMDYVTDPLNTPMWKSIVALTEAGSYASGVTSGSEDAPRIEEQKLAQANILRLLAGTMGGAFGSPIGQLQFAGAAWLGMDEGTTGAIGRQSAEHFAQRAVIEVQLAPGLIAGNIIGDADITVEESGVGFVGPIDED